MTTDDKPFAMVTQVGRWTWKIIVIDGISRHGPDGMPWRVIGGRERATRKAKRVLASYLLELRHESETFKIRADWDDHG
jgi:hypothetical protein